MNKNTTKKAKKLSKEIIKRMSYITEKELDREEKERNDFEEVYDYVCVNLGIVGDEEKTELIDYLLRTYQEYISTISIENIAGKTISLKKLKSNEKKASTERELLDTLVEAQTLRIKAIDLIEDVLYPRREPEMAIHDIKQILGALDKLLSELK